LVIAEQFLGNLNGNLGNMLKATS